MSGKNKKSLWVDHTINTISVNARLLGSEESGQAIVRAAEITATASEASSRIRGRYAIGVALLTAVSLWLIDESRKHELEKYKKAYDKETANSKELSNVNEILQRRIKTYEACAQGSWFGPLTYKSCIEAASYKSAHDNVEEVRQEKLK